MSAPAPSLAFILSTGAKFYANCDRCQKLTLLDTLAISVGRGEHTTVDKLKLRCRTCGQLARPFVRFRNDETGEDEKWGG